MVIKADCTTSIDTRIDKLQCDLNSYLTAAWCLEDQLYNCYPRTYRNRKDNGYVPELPNHREFTDVLLSDKVTATSFFGLGQSIAATGKTHTAQVHLVFFVNLEVLQKNDEQVRMDVYHILQNELYGFKIKSMVTGVERTLEEYTIKNKKDLLLFDSYPNHCFRFNMECTYDPFIN